MEERAEYGIRHVKLKSLTPTSEAENGQFYSRILNEELVKDDNYNIAITGGYGSGKSSVIETFLKSNNSAKPIRISLAAFNFVKNESVNYSTTIGINPDATNDQIQLELSLLQQLLYQSNGWDKDEVKNWVDRISFHKKIWISIALTLFSIIFSIILWNPFILIKWFSLSTVEKISDSKFLFWLSILVLFASLSWVVYHLLYQLRKVRVSKIDIKPLSFEIDHSNKISLLNTYSEKIIQLFSTNDRNVVILEDIDRLNSPFLFQKLREINNLLRYSPRTSKNKIKFIYSLKESIFAHEKEKNKFFDVIIPIVPYVNHNNSKDKLISLLKEEESNFNNKMREVIQYASYCIDDMRTILNIRNEYLIYKEVTKCNNLGNTENLLAIIIYKNLFPKDFEKTNSGESVLQKIFNDQDIFLKSKKYKLNENLKDVKRQLDEIQDDPELTESKLNLLKELKGKTSSELARLDSQPFMKIIENEDLSEYFDHFGFKGENEVINGFKFDFLVGMLKKGYIPPNFKHWVSLVHDGMLSSNDREFIFSIIKNSPLPFDYKLDEPSSVFNELTDDQWNNLACLNFDLFDYALHPDRRIKIVPIYEVMKNDFNIGLTFIIEYVKISSDKRGFMGQLLSFWDGVMSIILNSNIDKDVLLPYFLTLEDRDTLKNQNSDSSLTEYVNIHKEIIGILNKVRNTGKSKYLVRNMKSLEIKVENLDFNSEDRQGILDILIKNKFYQLNLLNVNGILNSKGISTTYLCFEYIKSLDLSSLRDYANKHKNEFIQAVMIPFNNNGNDWIEDKDGFIELLNDPEISNENKIELLKRVETELISFNEVEDSELWDQIVKNKKLECTWENLIEYVEIKGIDEILVSEILNKREWVNNLPQVQQVDPMFNEISTLIKDILKNEINAISLAILIDKYPAYFNYSVLSQDIKENNIIVLIKREALEPEKTMFDKLKELYSGNNLHIDFVIQYERKLKEKQPEQFLKFNKEELVYFLRNCNSNDYLALCLELNRQIILSEFEKSETNLLYECIIKCSYFKDLEILAHCINNSTLEKQIRLFNGFASNNPLFGKNEALMLLKLFCKPYNKIAESGTRQKLDYNEENKIFSKVMKKLGLINENKLDESKGIVVINRNYSS